MGGRQEKEEIQKILGSRREKKGSLQYWSRPVAGVPRDYPGPNLCVKSMRLIYQLRSNTTMLH